MYLWKGNKLRRVITIFSALVVFSALFLLTPGWGLVARLSAQQIPTATPDAEGVIYAQVQVGDTLWNIAARHEITLQALLDFNGLNESDFIQPGDVLIVGFGTPPATETPPPSPTATFPPPPPPATAVPPPPSGVCLLAFDDHNQDGIFTTGEPLKAGVAITIFNTEAVVVNYVTDGVSEPACFDSLPPGEYRVTRSVNQALGELLTTEGDQGIILSQGRLVNLVLGSTIPGTQAPAITVETPTAVPTPMATTTGPLPATAVATPTISSPATTPSPPRLPIWPWFAGAALLIGLAALYRLRRQN